MKIIKNLLVAAMAMGAVGPAVAAQETDQAKLHMFATQARVEIGNDGTVITVTPAPDLSAAVGQQVRSTVGAWRFAAPVKDGKPVNGVTYVRLAACAAPVPGGYRLAFDYQGNGPSRVGPAAPRFPLQQMRAGTSAKLTLTYRVGADGTAVIERIDTDAGSRRAARDFRETLEEWISNSKFEPERLADQPVATRMSFPIEFMARTKTFPSRQAAVRDADKEQQAWAAESTSCKTAMGNGSKLDRAVALDSPFELLSAID